MIKKIQLKELRSVTIHTGPGGHVVLAQKHVRSHWGGKGFTGAREKRHSQTPNNPTGSTSLTALLSENRYKFRSASTLAGYPFDGPVALDAASHLGSRVGQRWKSTSKSR